MAEPEFIVAIPARFGATRLPGKPLRAIAGEPMVVHVARRALAAGAREVVVATDDERIAQAVQGYPLRVCMTRADHHRYTAGDFAGLPTPLLMTEKDAVKCRALADDDFHAVPVRAELPEAFWIALLDRLPPRTQDPAA